MHWSSQALLPVAVVLVPVGLIMVVGVTHLKANPTALEQLG